MDANDLKEQLIAWWMSVIEYPDEHLYTRHSPGICPQVFLTSQHLDANKAPIWSGDRQFGSVVM
jgi:hypothetical protein